MVQLKVRHHEPTDPLLFVTTSGKLPSTVELRQTENDTLTGSDAQSTWTSDRADAPGFHARYAVAEITPSGTGAVLRVCPIVTVVQKTRAAAAMDDAAPTGSRAGSRARARVDLGETFGTKKRKQQLRAAETNRIDVSQLDEHVTGMLHEQLDAQAAAAPTRETLRDDVIASLPLPPFNTAADAVADAYPVDELLPPHVGAALPLARLLAVASRSELDELVRDLRTPQWVVSRLHAAMRQRQDPAVHARLRQLLFMALLWRFRGCSPAQLAQPAAIARALLDAPATVVDHLCETFAERVASLAGDPAAAAASAAVRFTPYLRAKLTSYMFALALHVDQFSVQVDALAKDLRMTQADARAHLRTMGCTLQPLTKAQLEAAGLSAGSRAKRAVLTVPLRITVPSRGPLSGR